VRSDVYAPELVIDLHCHILWGLDDGPVDLATSLELARTAAATGTRTIVATPHIREDYPFDPAVIAGRVAELNAALRTTGVGVEVVAGGEVAVSMLADLDEAALRTVALAGTDYLLVESPYAHASDLLESNLFDVQVRGFRVILAHPERSPCFQSDGDRLAQLVERQVGCSITAASLLGVFGRTVRRVSIGLLRDGLVHNVASDAHGPAKRTPDLMAGLRAVERELPNVREWRGWFTQDAPGVILAGAPLPEPPQLTPGGLGGFFRRRRDSRPPRGSG